MKGRILDILFALVMLLTLTLATSAPVMADGGDDDGGRAAGFASGAGKYFWEGIPGAPGGWDMDWHGRVVIHVKEAHDGRPARGFTYSSYIQDDLGINLWILDRPLDVAVVRGNECWSINEVVASSDPSLVGTLRIGGVLDGGNPGRNVDMLFGAMYPYDFFITPEDPEPNPWDIYEAGVAGFLGFYIPMAKGDVVVKAQ